MNVCVCPFWRALGEREREREQERERERKRKTADEYHTDPCDMGSEFQVIPQIATLSTIISSSKPHDNKKERGERRNKDRHFPNCPFHTLH